MQISVMKLWKGWIDKWCRVGNAFLPTTLIGRVFGVVEGGQKDLPTLPTRQMLGYAIANPTYRADLKTLAITPLLSKEEHAMKRIENYIFSAPKLRKGSLEYALWIDENGALFIQILRNLIETTEPGKHTKLLLRVSDYFDERHNDGDYPSILGINPETFQNEKETNRNNSGFINAILRHLFPKNFNEAAE